MMSPSVSSGTVAWVIWRSASQRSVFLHDKCSSHHPINSSFSPTRTKIANDEK